MTPDIEQSRSFAETEKLVKEYYPIKVPWFWVMVLAGAVMAAVYYQVQISKPIYALEDIQAVKHSVIKGDVQQLRMMIGLQKKCRLRRVQRYLLNVDNHATLVGSHFGTLGDGPIQPIEVVTDVVIPTEDTFQPGEYRYLFVTEAICAPGNHTDIFISPPSNAFRVHQEQKISDAVQQLKKDVEKLDPNNPRIGRNDMDYIAEEMKKRLQMN